ncbi:MAG TPA: HD domain-containing protein, partial [Candidatus Peribacteria bacterium]|nr:HD domain-containing protein [Candidatus Peribacteria bacterium]
MQWNEFRSHLKHLSAKDHGRIEQAFALGAAMHAGQKRKSGEPYYNHPIAVADMLADLQADADTIIAALLHDTVEDTPLTLPEIDAKFGGSVAELIDGLTKLNASELHSPQLNEQMESLRKIFRLMQADVRIMVIKLYDRLHNMQTVEFLPEHRKIGLANETLEVYVRIADRLCMQDLRDELEALCLAVLEPQHFPQLMAARLENEQQGQRTILDLKRYIQTSNPFFSKNVDIVFEHKIWEQLRANVDSPRTIAAGVTDVVAVFVCPDVERCYEALGVLHSTWPRVTLSFEDFINASSVNGYRGLHTTVILPGGIRVRCKIRTQGMHEYARRGITTLCFKQKSGVVELLSWTQRISPLTDSTQGNSDVFWESLKSEILGESILVYGPGDESVQLPKAATALDGMFHLFPDRVMRMKTVRINGKDALFSSPLTNGSALDATFSDQDTVQREWLQAVNTHLSAALIREALMRQSEEQKVEVGKRLLQQAMTERKRGFIEEFDESLLRRKLEAIGQASLHDVYVAIGEGRLEATDVYAALFERNAHAGTDAKPCVIRYAIDMTDMQTMDQVNQSHRKYGPYLEEIRYRRDSQGSASVTLRARLTPEQLVAFRRELTLAGAKRVGVNLQTLSHVALIAAVIVLWGLDPVFAHFLLNGGGLQASDLTIIRFLVFFVAAVSTYFLHRLLTRLPYKPLWPLQPSLVISGVMVFLTAVLSYVSLEHIPATQYIVFIIGGLAVGAAWKQYRGPGPTSMALVM